MPLREIALTDPQRAAIRVYDPSGPYTENEPGIDLAAGLTPVREAWIEAARLQRGSKARAIKPEDNGNVSADHLAPLVPPARAVRTGRAGQLVTQFEFARAGIVTEEMIYVAHRENLARERGGRRRAADASPTARASAPRFPNS